MLIGDAAAEQRDDMVAADLWSAQVTVSAGIDRDRILITVVAGEVVRSLDLAGIDRKVRFCP